MNEYLELMNGKVLKQINGPYLYMKEDNIIWLLHSADKRIFKATYYPVSDFHLPHDEYKVLNRHDIIID